MTELSPPPAVPGPAKVRRPRDAASLLLIDRTGGIPRVLMGRRNAGLAFMPGKYVFPGGSLDASDSSVASASELHAADRCKLVAGMGSRPSVARARALGLCAIRETFEETGLRIACPASASAPLRDYAEWRAFLSGGVLPDPARLRYFARAITPPGHPRRFDTRFFIAFCEVQSDLGRQPLVPSGELEDLGWMPLDEAHELDAPRITRLILAEAQALLARWRDGLPALPEELPATHYHERRGRFIREVI
ncbi:MAG: DNA mismatch repair protein MutT [Rhizobiales bacterium 63-22]|nr:MAG: DNA mismatch repair protein MutT [Rhizobiales bacterium 63-22]